MNDVQFINGCIIGSIIGMFLSGFMHNSDIILLYGGLFIGLNLLKFVGEFSYRRYIPAKITFFGILLTMIMPLAMYYMEKQKLYFTC